MPLLVPSASLSGVPMAVYGGSPAAVLSLEGIVLRTEVIETVGDSSIVLSGAARFGEALIADGVTVWLEGSFPSDARGGPVVAERAETFTTWEALRALLLSGTYELFLHYAPGDDPIYRKHVGMSTVLLRSRWADPLTIQYQLAAITSSHTLSSAGPGAS